VRAVRRREELEQLRQEDVGRLRCGRAQSSQKAVSVEDRVARRGRQANAARRGESNGQRESQHQRARLPSSKLGGKKKRDGFQVSRFAAVACVCCMQAEMAAALTYVRVQCNVLRKGSSARGSPERQYMGDEKLSELCRRIGVEKGAVYACMNRQ
jgi:hypothetical protein